MCVNAGSPFQYTVGSPPSGGALKVEIGGPGLEQAEVGKPSKRKYPVLHVGNFIAKPKYYVWITYPYYVLYNDTSRLNIPHM